MIGIRVDANKYIASGHVMRCLSIADALSSLGEETCFFTSDDFAEEMIQRRGYNAVRMQSVWNAKEDELDQLLNNLYIYQVDLLLVDSYQVTPLYLKTLHDNIKLAYLDDLNAFDYSADLVINYSINAENWNYPKNKHYLLGTKYTPLRKQFDISSQQLDEAFAEREKEKQILVTTGACDAMHVAEDVVREIIKTSALNDYRIVVVKGRFWDLEAFNEWNSNSVVVFENVDNMSELMLRSSMAVSAAGSTLYELCACCVPTVFFTYADNQLGNAKGFNNLGIMEFAGDVRMSENIGKDIVNRLFDYSNDLDKVICDREKMFNLGCGKGSECLAKALARIR